MQGQLVFGTRPKITTVLWIEPISGLHTHCRDAILFASAATARRRRSASLDSAQPHFLLRAFAAVRSRGPIYAAPASASANGARTAYSR